MDLYGDIPKSRNKELDSEEHLSSTPWTEIAKPPSPAAAPAPPEPIVEDSKSPPPPPVSKPERLAPPPSVLKKHRTTSTGTGTPHPQEVSTGFKEVEHVKYGYTLFSEIEDEYDPAKPNDYEEVIRARERKKQEAEMEAERQEQLKRELEDKERVEKERRERSREERANASLHDLEGTSGSSSTPEVPPSSAGEGKGMNLAQKMLEKFGWKEGEGLGKERQGIATPLIAQKTDNRSAVIIKAKHLAKPEPTNPPIQVPPIIGSPTKVVLLRNLVGPGEVDDDLEEEVAQELQNYGRVQSVLIFEVTEDDFPPEEAIRIFVELATIEEATKAATALHGRFFGGRVVRAGYFDEAKFAACDLAPVPGEFNS